MTRAWGGREEGVGFVAKLVFSLVEGERVHLYVGGLGLIIV